MGEGRPGRGRPAWTGRAVLDGAGCPGRGGPAWTGRAGLDGEGCPGRGGLSWTGWVGRGSDVCGGINSAVQSQCSNLTPICLFLFASLLKSPPLVAVGLLADIRLWGVVS